MFGFGAGGYYMCFNVGHLILAEKYHNIAVEAPEVLDGKEPTNKKCRSMTFQSLLFVNIVTAALYGIGGALYYTKLMYGRTPTPADKIWHDVPLFATRSCTLISGVILVYAVFSIREYFKKKEAIDSLDTAMILRHGLAFGLYLVCSLACTCALIAYATHPDQFAKYLKIVSAFFIVDVIGQVISELLLCQILWQWGTKDVPDKETFENDQAVPLNVIPMDEEEDLEAKIWNSLLKKRLQSMEGEMNFFIKSTKLGCSGSSRTITHLEQTSLQSSDDF